MVLRIIILITLIVLYAALNEDIAAVYDYMTGLDYAIHIVFCFALGGCI
jgi:hypothetical protein